MNPDQAESVSEREDRDGTAHALAHPALRTLAEFYPDITLDAKQIRSICSTATNGTVWRSVVTLFADNGWLPLVGNLLDRYRKAMGEKQPAAPRGRPPVELPLVVAPETRRTPLPAEERRRIVEEVRNRD